jgi:hypothetical protein
VAHIAIEALVNEGEANGTVRGHDPKVAYILKSYIFISKQ